MTYIKTKLKRSIDIDAIITLHYFESVSYTHLRAHETDSYLVCRLLLEKKKKKKKEIDNCLENNT